MLSPTDEVAASIGFVGLGAMGYPMARRLAAAGYHVLCFDHDIDRGRQLELEAGDNVTCARDLTNFSECPIVVCMLPDSAVVESVILGDRQSESSLAAIMQRQALIIDCGSSDPSSTIRLGSALEANGISLVDAPVSGGVVRALTGDLTIMVGGGAPDIERARPLLASLGSRVITLGRLGSGHTMKALNNILSAANFLAGVEAIDAGARFGLDPQQMVDVLSISTGNSWSVTNSIGPEVLTGRFASGFAMRLMRKDIGIASDIIDSVGAESPFLKRLADLWLADTAQLAPTADYTEIGAKLLITGDKRN